MQARSPARSARRRPTLIERAHAERRASSPRSPARASHAERHQAAGVDIIVAQGTEAGGHTGEIATMVLVPEVVDAVAPTPVLAAGGIGQRPPDRRGDGARRRGRVVRVGVARPPRRPRPTRSVKQKFLAATSSDTVRSRSLTGKPARMLRTRVDRRVGARRTRRRPLAMPLQSALVGRGPGAHRPRRRTTRAPAPTSWPTTSSARSSAA